MSKLGISIIGASKRSTFLLEFLIRYPQYGHITGIYDIVPEKCSYLLDRYNLKDAVIYKSLKESVYDEKVSAVFIGTPDNQHVEPTTLALSAGKHVYCEKPLATTLQDCDKIVAAAKQANSVFYVGKNLRHTPTHKKLFSLLEEGKVGRLLTIEANEYYYGGRTYFRRWNRLVKYGGGLWITKASHDFDLLNWFAGGNPTKIFAASNLSHYKPIKDAGPNCRVCKIKGACPDFYDINDPEKSHLSPKMDDLGRLGEEASGIPRDLCLYNSDKDTFDNGIAIVEYDNDIRATYTVNVVSARTTRQMRLTGTEGSAEGDMETGFVKYWKRHTNKTEEFDLADQINSEHGGADDTILIDFFNCCQKFRKPKSGWQEGKMALVLGLAARESCDTGTAVTLLDFFGESR